MSNQEDKEILSAIEKKIGLYPDFPKNGILFRDIMPIVQSRALQDSLIKLMADRVKSLNCDFVMGIESRGFLFGQPVAQLLNVDFVPIRKKGKLPGELYSIEYELEYGVDVLEVQKNCLSKIGSKCIIVDDLLATGGTMAAAKKLVELSGCQVVACLVVIELKALGGADKLDGVPLVTMFSY